jgi:hypothetical protein
MHPIAALVCLVFGAVCLFGGVASLTTGKWPAFMPPQLDIIAIPLAVVSDRLASIVGGVLAILVGVLCMFGVFGGLKGEGNET